MKKFEDDIVYSINYEPVIGGRLGDWLQQLMQNQNEIIDWIEQQDEDIHMQNVTERTKERNRQIEKEK